MQTRCQGVDVEKLRERLRWALEAGGLTPNALSLLIGVARASIGFIVNGHVKNPTINLLGAAAEVLGVSLDWLVWGEGDQPDPEHIRGAVARARQAREEPQPLATGTGG